MKGGLVMAEKFNVSTNSPCPICGKPDWCMWIQGNNGPLIACHRGTDNASSSIIMGYDGHRYVFSHMGRGGECYIYEDYEQHMNSLAEWKEKNGYINNPRHNSKRSCTIHTQKKYINKIDPCSDNPEHLDKVYSALLEHLKPDETTISYLKSEKWTDEMMRIYRIGTLPMSDARRYNSNIKSSDPWRKQLCTEIEQTLGKDCFLGVPGFYVNTTGRWTIYGAPKGGIIFPVFNIDGKIIRLRIRPFYGKDDFVKAEQNGKKLPKYINLHSCKECRDDENLEITNQLNHGCAAGNVVGFYMFNKRGEWINNPEVLFFTEGEKKSAVYNYISGKCVVCIQGVGSWRKFILQEDSRPSLAEECRNRGTRYAVVGFDADKETNYHVLKSENGLLTALKKQDFMVAVAEWNQRLAKGIDDLCVLGLEPQIYLC